MSGSPKNGSASPRRTYDRADDVNFNWSAPPSTDDDDSPEIKIIAVDVDEREWKVAGSIETTGEEFVVRVVHLKDRPKRGVVAIWTGRKLYEIAVIIQKRIGAAHRSLFEKDNGARYCDSDGDFDYRLANLPVAVWRYAYGRLLTPVHADDDADFPAPSNGSN